MPDRLKDRYEIIKQLSDAGGFSKTWLALDCDLPSRPQCLIKQFRPKQQLDDDTHQIVLQRFKREAAVLEKLAKTCQQVPKLYAYFDVGQEYYIVQEFIKGQTLGDLICEEGPLPETIVRKLLVSLLRTLSEIHA